MNANPIYSFLVEAMDTADRLPLDPRASLKDAVSRAGAIVDLPRWLPQFEALIDHMATVRQLPRNKARAKP